MTTSPTTTTTTTAAPVARRSRRSFQLFLQRTEEEMEDTITTTTNNQDRTDHSTLSERRRSLLRSPLTSVVMTAAIMTGISTDSSIAFVGSLPEWQNTDAILQGLTLRVTDPSQRQQMISFLQEGFDMQILRQSPDGVDTWIGYGPEQSSIPDDFIIPVSSFRKYGGHASFHIQYDAQSPTVYYRGDGNVPGTNVAYVQVGVPQYKISAMVRNGGFVKDAFGYVNVVAPSGLPLRGIVGQWPDPIMFLAIYTNDLKASQAYYEQTLGFTEQPYPYCRPGAGTGPFEPFQPKGSIYLGPKSPETTTSASTNTNNVGIGMGILLLPPPSTSASNFFSNQPKFAITPNPTVVGISILYNNKEIDTLSSSSFVPVDPSGIQLLFQSVEQFTKELNTSS